MCYICKYRSFLRPSEIRLLLSRRLTFYRQRECWFKNLPWQKSEIAQPKYLSANQKVTLNKSQTRKALIGWNCSKSLHNMSNKLFRYGNKKNFTYLSKWLRLFALKCRFRQLGHMDYLPIFHSIHFPPWAI